VTPEQLAEAHQNNLNRYRNKEITIEEFRKQQQSLYEQASRYQMQQAKQVAAGELEAKEVYGLPESIPVFPYRPDSDVSTAALNAFGSIKSQKLQEGYSIPEAEAIARQAISKTIRPATAEFYSQPDIGVSRIVDVEKGLVTDEETGEIRPAEGMELVTEAFGRQRLGTIPEVEAAEAAAKARAEAEKQRRTDYKAEYVRAAREAQRLKDLGILEGEFDPKDLTGLADIQEQMGQFQEDIIDAPPMTEEEIQEWLRQQKAQEEREERIGFAGPGDVDVIPYPKLLGEEQVKTALTEPVYTAGIVRETQLGRGLRALNTLPAVVAATSGKFGDEYLGTVETDTYRMADSADVVDQIAVNIAKMQGLPELFESSENVTDLIGETGAWWLGMGLEFPIPVGPGLALKAGSKGLVATGRAVGKLGAPGVAGVIEAAGSPYQYYLLKAEMARTQEMLDAVGSEKSAKEIVNEYYDKPFESADWVDASLKRNNLSEVSADTMAERLSVLHTIRAGLDAQGEIKIADLGTIKSTPTGKAIIASVQSGSNEPIEALTRANAGSFVTQEINKFKEAAKTNRDFARIYNEAAETQKLITEGWKRSDTPRAIRSNTLTSEFQSEVAKVRLATMSKDDIAKLILKSRQMDLDLNSPKFWAALSQEDVGRVMVDLGVSSVDEIAIALQNTLKVPIRENILNFLPQNLSVVAGGTVVNTSRLKGSQYKAFQNELKRRNEGITFDVDKGVFRLSKKNGRELITDLIEYAGLDRVRQSDSFRKMIDDLSRGEIAFKNRDMIDKVIKSTAAMKHLDAFKLREGGEQYRRALAAPEARGDVIALSEAKEFEEQVSKGAFGQITRDVLNGIKALRSRKTGLFPEVGVNVNADFIQLQKTTDSAIDTVYSQFDKEFKAKSKQLNSPVAALDELGLDAYQIRREPIVNRVLKTIDRSFDGNDVEYLNTFMDERYRNQIKNEIERLQRQGKEINLQQLILDYELYFTKLDSWKEILNTYYNPNVINRIFTKKGKGLRGILEPTFGSSKRPTESLILDLTYTNFVTKVIPKIEKRYGLKTLRTTFTRTPTPPIPFIEFILGSRRGDVVSKLQADWIDQNPNYRLEYYPQYTSLNMEVNLRPLTSQYNNMFIRTFSALNNAGIPINGNYLRQVGGTLGRQLANRHFDLVTKVTPGQRKELVDLINAMIHDKETLNPDLFSMKQQLQSVLDFPKATLDRMVEGIIKDVVNVTDQNKAVVDNIIQEAQDNVWRIFFDGKPVNGTYYGDPSLSVVQDVLDDLKRFYRANGIAIGNDLVNGLKKNVPLFESIRNTDYAALYGKEIANTFEEMYGISSNLKLRTMIDSLQKADPKQNAALKNMFGDALSWGRRSMTQGMLGGWPFPGTRYIGVNIFSGPIIMLGTVGLQRTFKALGSRRALAAMRQATSITQIPDAKVVFTSKGGRAYTAKELRMMEDQFNLGLSRGQVEFYEGQAVETLRAGGMTITGKRVDPYLATLIAQINPSQRNLYSQFADASDLTYRRAVFYSALADDMSINQAVDLAKKSVLDYGAMSTKEKEKFNRYTMFWSFTRQILSETVNATFKSVVGNAGHNYLASVIRASQKQINAVGAWLEGDDAAHARLFAIFKGKIDGRATYTFGLSNPYVESYETFINIAMMCAGPIFGEQTVTESALKFFRDGQTRPVIDFALKSLTDKHSSTVPPEVVYAAKAFGKWPEFKEYFGIATRPIGERRIQAPVFGDYEEQYYLPKTGQDADGTPFNPRVRFAREMLLFTLIGGSRNLRDYAKATMAADGETIVDLNPFVDVDERVDVKRFGTPTPIGYLFGLETSLPQKDILDMYFQERKRIERDLIKLYKE
jgi:DNA-directed RNA polymerase subunit N (RpoN/RPB10)